MLPYIAAPWILWGMVIMIQWINYPLEKEGFGNIKNPACKQKLMRQAFGGLEHILEQ